MHIWVLLFVCVINTIAQDLNTFGIGLSSQWLYSTEVQFEED
jgi:hypothetical protein